MAKTYRGERKAESTVVTVDGRPLDPRYDLRQLSQSGFEWGYTGAGPMQLSLAILADHFDDGGARALNDYKRFCELCIAEIEESEWTLSAGRIDTTLNDVTDVPLTLEQLFSKVRGNDKP